MSVLRDARMPGGKMAIGYAAFLHPLGPYPHSGNLFPLISRTPVRTLKSGVLFTPAAPLPPALVLRILDARLDGIANPR